MWRGRKAVYLQRNVRRYRKRYVNNGRPPAAEPSVRPPPRPAAHSSDDDLDDDDEYDTISSKRKETDESRSDATAADSYACVNRDGTEGLFDDAAECKFAYVAKKRHFLCRKSALERAWKVSGESGAERSPPTVR